MNSASINVSTGSLTNMASGLRNADRACSRSQGNRAARAARRSAPTMCCRAHFDGVRS